MKWENVVRIPTGTIVTGTTVTGTTVTACALAAALAVAGCVGTGEEATTPSRELFLQPVADQGPDPFTASTATSTATPPPLTRTPQPASSGLTVLRTVSGGTPGLYSGTPQAHSCDVQRQIDHLTADRGRAHSFARTAGISPAAVPGFLRGLTSVVLRVDTRVTNHGYRDGAATTFQSVLQAGTAVLVDDRGVPRVRCACGNPLAPPAATHGGTGTRGHAWSGYRPAHVIVVAPATRVVTDITIVDIVGLTWIERPVGHQGHQHDHAVSPPKKVAPFPLPRPHDSAGTSPDRPSTPPTDGSTSRPPSGSASPSESSIDCTPPTATVTPDTGTDIYTYTDSDTTVGTPTASRSGTPSAEPTGTPLLRTGHCPTATAMASPPTTAPDSTLVPPGEPSAPDLPDSGGTTPGDPSPNSVFGSPTDVFDS
jgi:hypothetical protein